MSTVTTTPTERVNPNEFASAFGKPLAQLFAEAINDHGVGYRRMDATHLRLFCGDRSVMPFKASRSRAVEDTTQNLLKWLSRNVPTWDTRNIKPETLEVLRDTINGVQEEAMTTTTPTPTPPTETLWVPVETSTGNSWGFETNGTTYRCTECGFTQQYRRGLHLHNAKHTGRASELAMVAAASHKSNVEKNRMLVTQALTVLAAAHGYGLTEGDAKGVEALTKELDAVKAELIKVTNERDEVKARLSLIQEAMKA